MKFITLCDEMEKIRNLAKQGRYFINRHALKRLKERYFEEGDVRLALEKGVAIDDSPDESKYRVVYRLDKRFITLSVEVRGVLVVKSAWESKKWEARSYEKEKMV